MTKITMNWNVAMPSAAVGEVPLGLRLSMISRPMGLRHQFLGFFAVDNFYSHNNLANADRFITLF